MCDVVYTTKMQRTLAEISNHIYHHQLVIKEITKVVAHSPFLVINNYTQYYCDAVRVNRAFSFESVDRDVMRFG